MPLIVSCIAALTSLSYNASQMTFLLSEWPIVLRFDQSDSKNKIFDFVLSYKISSVSQVTKSGNTSMNILIALLTNNTVFGPGFSYSDWKNSSRDQSNLKPHWLACRSINPHCWLGFLSSKWITQFTQNFNYHCLGGVNISFNKMFQFTDS